jgi:hypothetical protein
MEEDVGSTYEGLQVYTVGHLLPEGIGIGGGEDLQAWWGLDSEKGNQSGAQLFYPMPGKFSLPGFFNASDLHFTSLITLCTRF